MAILGLFFAESTLAQTAGTKPPASAIGTIPGEAPIITAIIFEGAEVPTAIKALAAPYVGKPAIASVLNALAQRLDDGISRLNVALYSIEIVGQNRATGALVVSITQGSIESARIEGAIDPRHRALLQRYADRLMQETPLSKQSYQRYLSLASAIPGLEVDPYMEAGSAPGRVALLFRAKARPVVASLAFNNFGGALVGRGALEASVQIGGLLGPGGQTGVYYARSTQPGRYQFISAAHSLPVGIDGMRVSLSGGHLHTRIFDGLLQGSARFGGVSVSYPLVQSFERTLTATAALDLVDFDNAILGYRLTSDRLRTLRLGIGEVRAQERHVSRADILLSRGIDMFAPSPGAIFTKISGRVSHDRVVGRRMIARFKAIGQYTHRPLPGSEEFSVGGAEFARGYENAIIACDRGYAGSIEMAWRPTLPETLTGTELFAFTEAAKGKYVRKSALARGSDGVATVGAGLRFVYADRVALDTGISRSIARPDAIRDKPWRLFLSLRLTGP